MKRWLGVLLFFGGVAWGVIAWVSLDLNECSVEQGLAYSPTPPVSTPAEKAQAVGVSNEKGKLTLHLGPPCRANGFATVCESYGMVKDEPRCIKLPKETAYDCLRWAGVLAASFSDKECLTPDDVAVLRPMAQACRVALPALKEEKR